MPLPQSQKVMSFINFLYPSCKRLGVNNKMKKELVEIAEGLKKYLFRNSEKLLIPTSVIVKALEDAFKKGEEAKEKAGDKLT